MFYNGILKSQATSPPPLRFPQKLWKIANECLTGAVSWSPDGKSILVRYSLFREEFMSTKSDLFKTDNISSFVRQLNLYGFRKGHEHAQKQAYKTNPDLHEFSNSFFQRDRPDLLDKVTRKSGGLRERNDLWRDSRKSSSDLADDSSDEKWEGVNTAVENNDHTYLSTQKPLPPTADANINALEQKIVDLVDCIHAKEDETSRASSACTSNKPDPQETDPSVPVKKKRGRKPGSKTNPYRLSKKFKLSRKHYYSPVLKNPQKSFLYFDDDDDDVFLRNTSRDVMLSSTMSFQETVESLALKEIVQRLHSTKGSVGYGLVL